MYPYIYMNQGKVAFIIAAWIGWKKWRCEPLQALQQAEGLRAKAAKPKPGQKRNGTTLFCWEFRRTSTSKGIYFMCFIFLLCALSAAPHWRQLKLMLWTGQVQRRWCKSVTASQPAMPTTVLKRCFSKGREHEGAQVHGPWLPWLSFSLNCFWLNSLVTIRWSPVF